MKQTLKKTIVLGFAFLLVAVGCSPGATSAPPAQPPPAALQPTSPALGKTPESVLKAITDALNKGDVETATALLADDVTQTLIPPPSGTGIYQGKEAMRARFKEVIALNAHHKFGKCDTEGDKVTCAVTYSDDSTKPLGFDLEMKAEAVVQNGLLKTVTWTMTDASLARMQAAMAPKPTPTFGPEILATKIGDVVGVWLVQLTFGDGEAGLTFKPDGTYTIEGISGNAKGALIDSGSVEFDGTKLRLRTKSDCLTYKGDLVPCTPTYQAYVANQGAQAVQLRLVSEDDQDQMRRMTLGGKRLTLLQPATAYAQSQAVTVTFAESKCAMNGPQKVPVGALSIDWNIVDKENDGVFGLCVVTLDEGKSIDDLDQAPGYPQPPWVTLNSCWSGAPDYRKTVSTEVKASPIYFVCFSSYTTKIGALGPIEVGK